MRLRYENPQLYEVGWDSFEKYSPLFCSLCAKVKDNVSYFIQTTMKEDVSCVTHKVICPFKQYERIQIEHLSNALSKARNTWKTEMKDDIDQAEIAKAKELIDCMSTFTESLKNAITHLETSSGERLWQVFEGLVNDNSILKKMSEFNLATVKPRILELTNGGPGVGVSSFEVRFRDAEIALLHNSDRRVRVHRATNDSGQNEAERSNACIGDALVDGGSLKWEYYEQYHGLEEEDLKRLSAKELEDLENE